MKQEKFAVTGMTCSACSAHVEKAVRNMSGIDSVNVNLLANSMVVNYDDSLVNSNDIIKTVESSGYGASVFGTEQSTAKSGGKNEDVKNEMKEMKQRLIISFIFLIPLFYISMGHMMNWPLPYFFHGNENSITFGFTQFLLLIPIVYVNFKFFTRGFKSLFNKSPNMDSLIAIGSTAAIIYGIYAIYKIGYGLGHGLDDMVSHFTMDLYFESAGTILTLITLGKFLEARAKGKTSEAIEKLIDLRPKTASVIRDGKEVTVSYEELRVGDMIIVRPGQTIPVDGVIVKGSTAVDESAITGESIPVDKKEGDSVTGATVNKSGYIEFEARKVGEDTALAQIIRLVEEASSSKAPIAKIADKISGVFVPVVITIAFLSAIVWTIMGYDLEFALSIGISVLVISCPCALGLATPTAIMVGTGKGAENGILIRSAESLETAHHVNTVIMDKTGTITEGRPDVTQIISFRDDFLSYAVSVEKLSEHPLGQAIVKYGNENNISTKEVTSFKTVEGRGIIAVIDNKEIYAGNKLMMEENGFLPEKYEHKIKEMAENGETPIIFGYDKDIIGIISVSDKIKESSITAVKALRDMGLKVVMLTGDNNVTANAIARKAGIEEVVSGVLPDGKEKVVRDFQEKGNIVAMVGDGINDAPALVRADVGVAIGSGTDIAVESADVILVKNSLLDVVTLIKLSKATIKNIKENLFWALIYNSIGIPLAAGILFIPFGWKLNPMFAAAAMSLSSVSVVSNALRLKFFKSGFENQINKTEVVKEEKVMERKVSLKVSGMMCMHCSGRVEKALNDIEGVTATVDLPNGMANIVVTGEVSNDILVKAVEDAGYKVEEVI